MSGVEVHRDERWEGVEPGKLSHLLEARRPALYFAAKIGDSIMTLPTVRALAEMFTAPLTLVAQKQVFDLCFHEMGSRLVDTTGVPQTGPTTLPSRAPDCAALASQIGEVDVFIDTVHSLSRFSTFADLRQRLAPTTTIGFKSRREEYDVAVPKEAWHTCDLLFKLARVLDPSVRIESYAQPVPLPPCVQEEARSIRATVPAGTKVLVVHADTDWREKRWLVTRFIELLDRFLSRRREFVAWIVGMGDEELNVGRERDRVVPYLGLPLDLAIGMVANADLFVGVDSCMLHAADMARVPGVGLFGPTRSVRWGFRFGPHRHIDRRRMADITVEEVLSAMEELADEHASATAAKHGGQS